MIGKFLCWLGWHEWVFYMNMGEIRQGQRGWEECDRCGLRRENPQRLP